MTKCFVFREKNLLNVLIPWFTASSKMASSSYTYGQLEDPSEKEEATSMLPFGDGKCKAKTLSRKQILSNLLEAAYLALNRSCQG